MKSFYFLDNFKGRNYDFHIWYVINFKKLSENYYDSYKLILIYFSEKIFPKKRDMNLTFQSRIFFSYIRIFNFLDNILTLNKHILYILSNVIIFLENEKILPTKCS